MQFFQCLICCGHLYVRPDSLKWASAVNITDTDIKTGLLHPKSGGVRSSCHLHFGHLQQDHRLLASHTAGQTPALTSLVYSGGARALGPSTILRVSNNFFFFPTTVVCDLELMHWSSQTDGMHFGDMTCFSFFLPLLVWTDELYPRVDLGPWVTHVHRLKLSAHMAEGRLDLLDTVKMHYSIPALLCSSFLSSLLLFGLIVVCRRVNHW